jgi:hypothetical protein
MRRLCSVRPISSESAPGSWSVRSALLVIPYGGAVHFRPRLRMGTALRPLLVM